MAAIVILLGLIILGLVIWDRCLRESTSADPGDFRPAARTPRPPERPRFQGRGVVSTPKAGSPRFAPGAAAQNAPPPRFSGEVRRAPNAIGLACGRPIAECDRGEDCLCVD